MNMLTKYLPKEKLVNLSLLLFLALILPAAIVLVQQTNITGKKATATAAIKGTLVPATATKNRGDVFSLAVNLTNITTTDKALRVSTAVLQYDPNVLEIQGTRAGTDVCGPKSFVTSPCDQTNFPTKACVRIYENDTKVELSCYRDISETLLTFSPNQAKSLAAVTFKVKDTATLGSTTTVSIIDLITPEPASDSANIADGKENAVITIASGATATATPPPSGGSVDLKFRMRDVTSVSSSCYSDAVMNFKVKFIKDGVVQTFNTVPFTPFPPSGGPNVVDGIWTLRVNGFDKVAGNYDIYIKGPKQLQKKFPAKALTAADPQTIDLTTMGSRYYLEGGDLPRTGVGQDGAANTADSLFLIGCFGRETEANCLTKPDLNYDCNNNVIDNDILNNTIYNRWDDESA